jgi:hypothetical protein
LNDYRLWNKGVVELGGRDFLSHTHQQANHL